MVLYLSTSKLRLVPQSLSGSLWNQGFQDVYFSNIITFSALCYFTLIALCTDTYSDRQPDNWYNSEDYCEGSLYSVELLHEGIANMLEYMAAH